MKSDFFPTAFSLFCRDEVICPPVGQLFTKWQPYYLLHLKYPSIPLFLSATIKRFWNLPIIIWSGSIILVRCNLPKNNLCFTPWLLHLYTKKWIWKWQYFLQLFWCKIHLNFKINKPDWLKQFDMTSTLFFLFLSLF